MTERKKWQIVADAIRARIVDNTYPAGETIPSYDELKAEFECSRFTIAQGIDELEREGLVVVSQGRGGGTKVRDVSTAGISLTAGDNPQAWTEQHPGESTDTLVVAEWVAADAEIAARLAVAPGTQVIHRVRHMTKGSSMAKIHESWYRGEVARAVREATGYDFADKDAHQPEDGFKLSARGGYPPAQVSENPWPRYPSAEEARTLEIPPTMPVQIVDRHTLLADGTPIETCTTVTPADRERISFKFDVDYTAYVPAAG